MQQNNTYVLHSLDKLTPTNLENLIDVAQIQILASDVDGTLTKQGKLSELALTTIARLADAGIIVMLVSGRPAGEVLGLCRYLSGVLLGIAENGLVEVVPNEPPQWLGQPSDQSRLKWVGDQLNKLHGANLRLCADIFCRLGDIAYERDGRSEEELSLLQQKAQVLGAHMIWSSVHIHLALEKPDKGRGLLQVLERRHLDPKRVATIGDAPNDAGLFVSHRFGLTVGTADVLRYRQSMTDLPQVVTANREIDGFVELAELLLQGQRSSLE